MSKTRDPSSILTHKSVRGLQSLQKHSKEDRIDAYDEYSRYFQEKGLSLEHAAKLASFVGESSTSNQFQLQRDVCRFADYEDIPLKLDDVRDLS